MNLGLFISKIIYPSIHPSIFTSSIPSSTGLLIHPSALPSFLHLSPLLSFPPVHPSILLSIQCLPSMCQTTDILNQGSCSRDQRAPPGCSQAPHISHHDWMLGSGWSPLSERSRRRQEAWGLPPSMGAGASEAPCGGGCGRQVGWGCQRKELASSQEATGKLSPPAYNSSLPVSPRGALSQFFPRPTESPLSVLRY